MTEIKKFKSLPDSLHKFSQLPIELHHKIYENISYDVWNAIWNYHLDWHNIIEAIGNIRDNHINFNELIELLNDKIPQKANLTINNDVKRNTGMYLKYTSYGINYIQIDSQKATNLIMLTIDNYLKSEHYNAEIMFDINARILVLYKMVDAGPIYELALPNDDNIQEYMNNIQEELEDELKGYYD